MFIIRMSMYAIYIVLSCVDIHPISNSVDAAIYFRIISPRREGGVESPNSSRAGCIFNFSPPLLQIVSVRTTTDTDVGNPCNGNQVVFSC